MAGRNASWERFCLVLGIAVAACSAPAGSRAEALCFGDCDGDGRVVVAELVTAVRIAVAGEDDGACEDLDANGSGEVTVDEVILAVREALDDCPALRVTRSSSDDAVTLRSRALRVVARRDPLRLAVFGRGSDEALTEEPSEGGLFFDQSGKRLALGEVVASDVVEDGVRLTVATPKGQPGSVTLRFLTDRTLAVTFDPPSAEATTALGARLSSPSNEAIYGLTERLRDSPPFIPGVADIPTDDVKPVEVGSLNRRGETVEMFIRPTFSLYAPFYQTSRGYGVAVAGTMPGVYDLAQSDPGVVSFEFETGTVPENRRLAFYVIYGPEHATILDEYTRLTGRPFVPPEWAFLNWRWRGELAIGPPADLDGVPVNAEVAEDVLMYERFGIPPGVYLFDRPVLEGNYGFARFEWDEERLPNPGEMLDSLRRRGYRLATWSGTWLCGNESGDNGAEGQSLGYIAPGPGGPSKCADVGGTSFIMDVTNPDARTWFRDKLADFLRRWDIQGVKLDRGEEHIPSESTDVWADGRNGREVHNDYVLLQTTLHHDALRAAHPDGDFVLFTRSGYTGAQKDAVFWGGDIPASELFGLGPGTDLGLRSAIISQQRAGFMGFPIWGSDTGGYYEFKDREVFARWLEFSAFSGLMEIGGFGNHAPWDMPTEPVFDEEMIEIYRRYVQARHDMIDYVVAVAAEAATGMPMVRPMVFLDAEDPQLLDLWSQYLFGPDLMVAPVWKVGERSREVYFPRGRWRSLWDGSQQFEGPTTVTLDAPLDTILVFVRGDAPSPIRSDGGS